MHWNQSQKRNHKVECKSYHSHSPANNKLLAQNIAMAVEFCVVGLSAVGSKAVELKAVELKAV